MYTMQVISPYRLTFVHHEETPMASTCNCGMGLATEKLIVSVRVMSEHRDEERTAFFCGRCAEATVVNGLGRRA